MTYLQLQKHLPKMLRRRAGGQKNVTPSVYKTFAIFHFHATIFCHTCKCNADYGLFKSTNKKYSHVSNIPCWSSPFALWFYSFSSITVWVVGILVCRCKIYFSFFPSLENSPSLPLNLELAKKKRREKTRPVKVFLVFKEN